MKMRWKQWLLAALVAPGAALAADAADTPDPGASAPDAAAAQATAPAASATRAHRPPPRRLTVAQRIDIEVGRLAKGLDLDANQQESLRQILAEQHIRIMKLRGAVQSGATDAAGNARAIYDQTKSKIRSILNEDQRKKYISDVPPNELAPDHADLNHWIDMQDAARRGEHPEGSPK